ncbi:MAG: alanine--tRNA ligase [Candidatus Azambacteria bacterium]|nr:alanine--tRNA ligase [Candidatus Azambacteria bacterium]
MTANELRQKYLDFFREKGHTIIPSASLIPENDPTVLFTTAGMHPLVPYLLGEKHQGGRRLAGAQKCIRTSDIDEVGDATHHTFFEMLGNWSLGDYFKKEAIEWSWEFLTSPEWLGLDKNKLAVSVFAGDSDLPAGRQAQPFDKEAFDIWRGIGMAEKRIAKLPKKNNWWGPAGETGPCGPDSEMFYWIGDTVQVPESFNDDNDLWVEIWNDVFMQFNKNIDGKYEKLGQQNVDTGMGLERVLAVINGVNDNYKTELFCPLIQKIEELSGKRYDESAEIKKTMRIIADHIKAGVFLIADGIEPSNTGRGYVLRRLLRRAKYYYGSIGAKDKPLDILVEYVALIYKDVYPELLEKKNSIEKIIIDEENTFVGNLMFGRRLLEKIISKEKYISDDNAFLLYSTYGFPFELILDIARENNTEVDVKGFNRKKTVHQELSRTASAGMFKGGLADNSEQTAKYHTATHLLLAALRQVLGEHIFQKGSNITAERLRFDFSHPEKINEEQKKKVEELVNIVIQKNLPVVCEEMSFDEAKEKNATGVFEHKYGERVKVYTIGEDENIFSREICGGPHALNTGVLGRFKIIKEEAVSAGVRRVKAVLE